MSKPGGRPQKTTKSEILRILAASPYGLPARDLFAMVSTCERVVRGHLRDLVADGSCKTLDVAVNGGGFRRIYGVSSRPLVIPPGEQLIDDQFCEESEPEDPRLSMVQVRVPAGQWRADHIPSVRSVFDLGVAA